MCSLEAEAVQWLRIPQEDFGPHVTSIVMGAPNWTTPAGRVCCERLAPANLRSAALIIEIRWANVGGLHLMNGYD